jgi:hypothetical protein
VDSALHLEEAPEGDRWFYPTLPPELLTGFGLTEDGEHAPNKSLALSQFSLGIETIVYNFNEYLKLTQ